MGNSIRLIIGIPSWNEAENIERITKAIEAALLTTKFSQKEVLLVNADNGSTDNTVELFLNTSTSFPKEVISSGQRGKGHNFKVLFEYFAVSNAQCLITIDADLEIVRPDWFEQYYTSIADNGHAMAFPAYFRYWFDGNMTNQIIYPVIAGATGIPVRQPMGGEFAFSHDFAKLVLEQEWNEWTYGFGIDIFCALTALRYNSKIDQVFLSHGKFHHQRSFSPEEMEKEFDNKFLAMTGTLFTMVTQNEWKKPEQIEFIPHRTKEVPDKDFDIGYIETSAVTAFYDFKKYDEPSGLWPAISNLRDLDSNKWVEVLATMHNQVKSTGQIKEELFITFRRLFYIRMVSALSVYTDDNVESELEEMIRRLHHRIT